VLAILESYAVAEDNSEEAIRRTLLWELARVKSRLAELEGRVEQAERFAAEAQQIAAQKTPPRERFVVKGDIPLLVDVLGVVFFGILLWLFLRELVRPVSYDERVEPTAEGLLAAWRAEQAAKSAARVVRSSAEEIRRLKYKKHAFSLLARLKGFVPILVNTLGIHAICGVFLVVAGILSTVLSWMDPYVGVLAAIAGLFAAVRLWSGLLKPLQFAMRRFPLFCAASSRVARSPSYPLGCIVLWVLALLLFAGIGLRFVQALQREVGLSQPLQVFLTTNSQEESRPTTARQSPSLAGLACRDANDDSSSQVYVWRCLSWRDIVQARRGSSQARWDRLPPLTAGGKKHEHRRRVRLQPSPALAGRTYCTARSVSRLRQDLSIAAGTRGNPPVFTCSGTEVCPLPRRF
jgi:hypothetical protein